MQGRDEEVPGMAPGAEVEEIFSKIIRHHASWPVNDAQSASRQLGPLPVSVNPAHAGISLQLEAFGEAQGLPAGHSLQRPEGLFRTGDKAYGTFRLLPIRAVLLGLRIQEADARIFLAGAGRMGLRPDEILYIGDSFENDIDPSQKLE